MALSVFKLVIASVLPIALAVVLDICDKKNKFGRLSYAAKQIIFGVLFGGMAIMGTEWGISMHGAVVNCRDAAPIIAGLFFGGPAGIIAGVIGGIERWIAVAWGVGSYTRVACSVSTVLAGIIAAVLRKIMFDHKRPNWFMSMFCGVSIEVFHLMMVFITNVDNAQKAINVVRACTIPMVVANGAAVAGASIVLYMLSAQGKAKQTTKDSKPIFKTIQNWLLAVIFIALIAVSGFMILLESNMAKAQIDEQLHSAMDEVTTEVKEVSDRHYLDRTALIAKGLEDGDYNLSVIAQNFDVKEINVVNREGIIVESTRSDYVGFDMSSGEQSAEFLCLLDGTDQLAQAYGPISKDSDVYMKYVGVAIADGFVQTGYDTTRVQAGLNSDLTTTLKNRHVASDGFFVVFDDNGAIVSTSSNCPSQDRIPTGAVEFELLDTDVVNTISVNDTDYYYMLRKTEGYDIAGFCEVNSAKLTGVISIYISIFDMILVFAVLFVLIYMLIKNVVVNQLVSMASSLGKISAGNLDEVVNVRSNAEFASLSDDINKTVDTLKRYIDEAASRIDAELEFARTIQISAMPNTFPAFPNRKDFDIYARMDTAKEVGGDFYDLYMSDADQLNFLIADVSGKGIPAAMFMMRAKSVLKAATIQGIAINEVFIAGNNQLCQGNDADMFVTAWQASLDLKTGSMHFANAGHNPPLIRHRDGSFEFYKVRANLVLGSMEGIRYADHELQLEAGDIIFLYTDGVTEATNANEELYGDDRLLAILNSREFESMQEICDTVKEDVDKFVGDAPQFDDITMLAFTYYGS